MIKFINSVICKIFIVFNINFNIVKIVYKINKMINRGFIIWWMYMYVFVYDYDVLVIKIFYFKIIIYESLDEMKCF